MTGKLRQTQAQTNMWICKGQTPYFSITLLTRVLTNPLSAVVTTECSNIFHHQIADFSSEVGKSKLFSFYLAFNILKKRLSHIIYEVSHSDIGQRSFEN